MACNAGEIEIAASDLLADLHISVRLPRLFSLRLAVAARLFRLAGWVSGTNVVVELIDSTLPDLPPINGPTGPAPSY